MAHCPPARLKLFLRELVLLLFLSSDRTITTTAFAPPKSTLQLALFVPHQSSINSKQRARYELFMSGRREPLFATTSASPDAAVTTQDNATTKALETSPDSSFVPADDLRNSKMIRRLFFAATGAIGVACLMVCAPIITNTLLSSSILSYTRKHRILRKMGLGAASVAIAWQFVQWRAVKRRQASDATSEWARYARHPGARGRALMVLLLYMLWQYTILCKFAFVWNWLDDDTQATRISLPWKRQGTRLNDDLDDKRIAKDWRTTRLEQTGEQLTTGLLQLGPLYIKLGQIISCRENLLPAEWIRAMERLQDRVPAQTGPDAMALALAAWSSPNDNHGNSTRCTSFNETFAYFDTEPLAAASLGQVHKAVLRESGEVVAIKLQRPFLREMYDQDFALLTKMAAGIDRLSAARSKKRGSKDVGSVGGVSQNWTDIFQEAEEILYREIDYRDEADNTMHFCADFGLTKQGKPSKRTAAVARDGKALPSAAQWLRAPYVYYELSSEKVLVMEFVPSIKITKSEVLKAAGVTNADKEYLADCLARSYLRQFCCHYFFSTDPHAGNLGVEVLDLTSTVPERRVRLVFYDFGQAASLEPIQGEGILEIIDAIVDSDVEKSIDSFQKMGVLKPDADLDNVRSKVADNFRTGRVKANRKRLSKRGYKLKPETQSTPLSSNATAVAKTASDSEIMNYFTMPSEYAFVARALVQMDGVGKSLDTDFDFVSAAAPWIYEIKGVTTYLQEEVLKKLENLKECVLKMFQMSQPKRTTVR